jgi:hypothetical protein
MKLKFVFVPKHQLWHTGNHGKVQCIFTLGTKWRWSHLVISFIVFIVIVAAVRWNMSGT